jgi:hypothetical protein
MRSAPTAAAVRTTLRILVQKGHLRTFGGSAESALATLLDIKRDELDEAARKRLKRMIDQAAKEGH